MATCKNCRRGAFIIFTVKDDDGNERCIDCDRIIKPAPIVKPAA